MLSGDVLTSCVTIGCVMIGSVLIGCIDRVCEVSESTWHLCSPHDCCCCCCHWDFLARALVLVRALVLDLAPVRASESVVKGRALAFLVERIPALALALAFVLELALVLVLELALVLVLVLALARHLTVIPLAPYMTPLVLREMMTRGGWVGLMTGINNH